MSDTKISADPLITLAALTDYLPIISGGVNKRIAVGDFLKFDFANVKKQTTDQQVNAGSHVKVTMNTVTYDPAGYWSAADNGFVVPAGKGGMFIVVGQIQWRPQNPEQSGYRFIDMLNVGGGIGGPFTWPDNKVTVYPIGATSDPGEIRQQVIGFGILADGESVALYAEQDNPTSTNNVYVQAYNTWFSMIRLGKGG